MPERAALQAAGDTATVVLPRDHIGYVAFNIAGTFVGTVSFEVSADDGVTYVAVAATPAGGGAAVTSATAAGVWYAFNPGYTHARARMSAFTSGVANARINDRRYGA